MKESLGLRDYSKYMWQKREILWGALQGMGVVVLVAFFFYRSVIAILPMSIVGYFFFRELERSKKEAYRESLIQQFRECMLSVVANMRAGYAVENSFLESREDMRLLYGETSAIYQELEIIRRGLVINITLEELLSDLALRSASEEIAQFAEVFCIAKRNSGNLADIMEASAQLIGRRMDAAEEIQTVLSGRRMEQNVMKIMPFAVMLYIGLSYSGYFDVLYHNLRGVLTMSGCLLLYLAAYVLSDRIMQRISREML